MSQAVSRIEHVPSGAITRPSPQMGVQTLVLAVQLYPGAAWQLMQPALALSHCSPGSTTLSPHTAGLASESGSTESFSQPPSAIATAAAAATQGRGIRAIVHGVGRWSARDTTPFASSARALASSPTQLFLDPAP